MNKLRQNLIALIVVALLAVVGLWAAYIFLFYPPQDNGLLPADPGEEQTIGVAVVVMGGEGPALEYAVDAAAEATVFDVTKQAAAMGGLELEYKAYPGLGVLVTGIGGDKNGQGDAYWQYWVNGAYANEAADRMTLEPGDRVEWRFLAEGQQTHTETQ